MGAPPYADGGMEPSEEVGLLTGGGRDCAERGRYEMIFLRTA